MYKNNKLTKEVAKVCLKNGMFPYETEAQRQSATCLFCGEIAVGIYYLDKGCVAKTNRVQALCLQHENKSPPVGSIELLWHREVK